MIKNHLKEWRARQKPNAEFRKPALARRMTGGPFLRYQTGARQGGPEPAGLALTTR
jgi:hypothetical protein